MTLDELKNSDKLNQYLFGLLTAPENEAVEALLLKHPELLAETQDNQNALTAYAEEYSQAPSPNLKGKVMNAIHQLKEEKTEIKLEPIPTPKTGFNFFKIAASFLLLLSVGLGYKLTQQNAEISSLSGKLAANEIQLANKESAFTSMQSNMAALYENNVLQVKLKSTDTTKNMYATVFYNKTKKQIMVHQGNLAKRTDGMQYQLWAIIDGKPVSAGMFDAENNTDSLKTINADMNAQLFAVSIEKQGGAATPTPERIILISGKI